MRRQLLSLLAVLAVSVSSADVSAEQRKWTGFSIGVHGGVAKTDYASNLGDGSKFCATAAEAVGGTASASCEINGHNFILGGEGQVGDGTLSRTYNTETGEITGFVEGFRASSTRSNSLIDNTLYPAHYASFVTSTRDQQLNTVVRTLAVGLVDGFDLGDGRLQAKGGTYGAHIGYNYHRSDDIVIGFEADITRLANDGDSTSSSDDAPSNPVRYEVLSYSRSVSIQSKYLASARLKLGKAMGDYLPYITAGLAYSEFKGDVATDAQFRIRNVSHPDIPSTQGSFSDSAFGAVVGAGLSWRASDNIILSGEALYYHFDKSVDISDLTINEAVQESVGLDDVMEVRVKLSIGLN